MDNQNKGWAFVFLVIGAGFVVYLFLPTSSEIPPTTAFSSVSIENSTSERINATTYNTNLIIISDGSINLEFVRVP